ncbi:MAG: NADH-quinone oxidoreductase subunit M [Candidatus Eisenbacteria bacterium]|uniref:NADH-quinone oxidoreductase subunit M n=1 Tax=Eiseniibacteriota bacterium TaxID=2212470 RepID=A0A538SEH0_UNCEI|nr:MAG: NADH-quinone oxidoreductase subunit M [Candidatus Eisenbacteria bacterium]TMQ61067.1 MAG: NADH-quinone oxidoreductase subunit M [Candidatus Eisenbacteria bacterium]
MNSFAILGVPILTFLTFFPTVGALLILLLPSSKPRTVRIAALVVSLLTFAASIPLFTAFDSTARGMQFVERAPWVASLGISYHLGVDGISMLLILLTTLLTAVSILFSFSITSRVKAYMVTFLLLETGMIGVFAALDLFLFYIFWEVMLIPMYLLIGVWGGPRRIYAAVKFILYTVAGSLLMLVGILYLYYAHHLTTGAYTFDLLQLYDTPLAPAPQLWLFGAFALAFAIKVPMFPFHTWLPDAHVEAPTAGSVILAGVLLKMGVYGFLRFAIPLFPEASMTYTPWIVGLALVGIVYGALVAMVQRDVKKLVAYSSVSHLGFVMLGLFVWNTQGMAGGILQSINHGLSTGALFLAVGILYERRHTREISEFGGLAAVLPWFAALFMIICLSSIGLPGLNGFIGEFLILLGAFRAAPVVSAVAATGVILAAIYLLWMYQRVMFGPVTNEKNRGLPDLSGREFWTLAPVILFIVWIGVYPNTFLRKLDVSVTELLARAQARTISMRAPASTVVPAAAEDAK